MESRIIIVDEERLNRIEEKIDSLLNEKIIDDNKVLNAEEVAELLGLSVQTVYAKARDGSFPSYNAGRSVLFLKGQLLKAVFKE